jgi:peroxiredoxin
MKSGIGQRKSSLPKEQGVKYILLAMGIAMTAISGALASGLKPYTDAPLPDIALKDLRGKQYSLSALKGKVVMINFWATYCTPCIKEMPSMQRLNDRLKDKPFQILAIDMAEDPATITAFMTRLKLDVSFPILLDKEGAVAESWRVSAIPATFIIDTQGTLRYVNYGALEWDSGEVIGTITGLLQQ